MARKKRFSNVLLCIFIFGACILVLQPGSEGKDAGVGNMFGWEGTNFGDEEWFNGIGIISYFAAFI